MHPRPSIYQGLGLEKYQSKLIKGNVYENYSSNEKDKNVNEFFICNHELRTFGLDSHNRDRLISISTVDTFNLSINASFQSTLQVTITQRIE